MREQVDLTGLHFGRLKVLNYLRTDPNGKVWLTLCTCGTIGEATTGRLRTGNTKSCGCLRSEMVSAKNYKHGRLIRGKQMPEYYAFLNARKRCTDKEDKRFEDYGGRGIKFLFTDFKHFLSEVGLRPSKNHSIDRKDNSGNYEIGNVRWATRSEQQRNTRDRWAKRRIKNATRT